MEPGVIERLLYLNFKLWRPKGFSTLILMVGNQGTSSSELRILLAKDQNLGLDFKWWVWKFCWNIWLKMCDLPFFLFLDLNFLFRSKTIDFYEVLWNFSSFIFWNLFMEICLSKIFSGDFSFSWRCVHGDLFMVICPLKICSGDFSHWRFIQEIFPFSWRFVHGDLFRRFFLLWRCVHGDLSIEDWSVGDLSLFEDLSFENLNKRFIPWKFVYGDLSFENFIFGDFSFLKNILGDLSFWIFLRRLFFWKKN